MEEIIKGLYLGSDADVPKAKERGYSQLAACKDGPDGHRAMLGYDTMAAPKGKEYLFARRGNWLALNLIDHDDPTMIPWEVIETGLKFIAEQMNAGNKIFVHCNAGVSRSPSLVMMYLRSVGELPESLREAFKIFKALYPKADPQPGMRYHLMTRWRTLRKV